MNAWISDGGDVLRMTDGDRKGVSRTNTRKREGIPMVQASRRSCDALTERGPRSNARPRPPSSERRQR